MWIWRSGLCYGDYRHDPVRRYRATSQLVYVKIAANDRLVVVQDSWSGQVRESSCLENLAQPESPMINRSRLTGRAIQGRYLRPAPSTQQ